MLLYRTGTRQAAARRVRLFVERLEDRYCPSAPSIDMFGVSVVSGTTVQLVGHVTADNPSSVQVTFSGVVSGTGVLDSAGNFNYTASARALGTVFANAVDGAGLASNTAQAQVSSAPPTFQMLTVQYGQGHTVTISGTLVAPQAANQTVHLSGVVAGSVTTDANGHFTYTGTASALGNVQVSATDPWGQTGTGTVAVADSTPSFTQFTCTCSSGNYWVFYGYVQAQAPQGMTVHLNGLADVHNVAVTVGSNGYFNIGIQLQPGETGTVSADLTDWWGLAANTAFAAVS